METIDQLGKQYIIRTLDERYEKTESFSDEFITTDTLMKLLRQDWPPAVSPVRDFRLLNRQLLEWGYSGQPISGTDEYLWRLHRRL